MDEVADAKALANPLRLRILRELRLVPAATATTLARRLDLTTGATSYHLRVLARHGFVTEIPERAHGRERWWRLIDDRSNRNTPIDAVRQLLPIEDLDAFARFEANRVELGPWAEAMPYSRGSIRVSLSELESFFEDYLALLRRYQRPDRQTPPDARTVRTRFIAFPEPD